MAVVQGDVEIDGRQVELVTSGGPPGCDAPSRYGFQHENRRLTLDLITDACTPRRMILDRSTWRPSGESDPLPSRKIVRTAAATRPTSSATAASAAGNWPTFRGFQASGIAEGQNLPDQWDVRTGANVLWRTPIPGLAHSSPVVWGDRIFLTSAVSSDPKATFRPGLYGDGDASTDRSIPAMDAVLRSTSGLATCSGNAWRTKACPSTSGTSNPRTPVPRRQPMAASWSRGSARMASMRTM